MLQTPTNVFIYHRTKGIIILTLQKNISSISSERLKVHRSFCGTFDRRPLHVNLDQIKLSQEKNPLCDMHLQFVNVHTKKPQTN